MLQQDLYHQYMRNMLHLNNGDGTFSEIGQLAGVSNTDWSWCPLLADFDNDGYKDLFISNGYLRDYTNKDFLRYWGDYKIKKAMAREPFLLMDLVTAMPSTAVPDYIFRNNHDLTFSNQQVAWGLNQTNMSNGAVYADLDNDGDLELIVNTINQPASIYRNRSTEDHHAAYLALKLTGAGKNTQAVGAKVYVYTTGNEQYQEVNPNRGYLSCVPTTLHFGLGASQVADSVRIIWPDQTAQLLTKVKANQLLKLTSPAPKQLVARVVPTPKTVFQPAAPLFAFQPEEVVLNDFKRQLLMLFMYSKTAPVFARADVNKDGLDDLFVSGGAGELGRVYVQQAGGTFRETALAGGPTPAAGTVAAATFLDANGDAYPDLYLAKGGYALYEPGTADLQDELYLNDGKGRLVLAANALPSLHGSSKGCVRATDVDGDGDQDLFVGGRVIPGQYPLAPPSYLLLNDGNGHFTTAADAPFARVGMVTDAQWVDLNHEKRPDLVLCGEMMPIMVWINTPQGFTDQTSTYFDAPQQGFWFSLHVTDVNQDGQPDIVAGNLGQNSQIRATAQQPAELYYADFDNNGSIDPFFNFYLNGKSYPFVSRDELNEEIYPMRRRFTSYKAYADATMQDIFPAAELSKASKLEVNETRTMVYLKQNGKFTAAALPTEAQFSAVTHIVSGDYNHDGHPDLLLLGNHSDNRLKLGSLDANYGCLLQGDGKGTFRYVPQPQAGLCVLGDVKSVSEVTVNKQPYLVVGVSNGPVQFYKK